MKKTKAYYLSEDIDPMLWESVSDAYNDLSVYAYRFIAYKSDIFPIPEELIGDVVLMACERAFKYRYSYNIEISKLHNWINTIIKRVLIRIHNKLPNDQRLDAIINRAVTDFDTDYDMDSDEPESEDDVEVNFEVGASPEHNILVEEVQRIRKEVADALKNHIDHLKPLDREIFIKAYIDDIPFKVIASQTGLTETAARKRAFDIKNRIRHKLPSITPWKVSDMLLYNKVEDLMPVPLIGPEEEILLKLYPQYDTRGIEPEDTDTIHYENLVAVHELLRSHLEMCIDDYNSKAEEGTDVYSELKEELCRRGREIRDNESRGDNMFIIEDVLHSLIEIAGDEIDSLIDIRA